MSFEKWSKGELEMMEQKNQHFKSKNEYKSLYSMQNQQQQQQQQMIIL